MGCHSVHLIFYYRVSPFRSFDLDPMQISFSFLFTRPLVGWRGTGMAIGESSGTMPASRSSGLRWGVGFDEWLPTRSKREI
ncbi:hypothetical protein NL676_030910 [Syzygium grande]|nr:hypothetical protein NL676_030910 [Syzygium grande]